jgi:hypothetical protein
MQSIVMAHPHTQEELLFSGMRRLDVPSRAWHWVGRHLHPVAQTDAVH